MCNYVCRRAPLPGHVFREADVLPERLYPGQQDLLENSFTFSHSSNLRYHLNEFALHRPDDCGRERVSNDAGFHRDHHRLHGLDLPWS